MILRTIGRRGGHDVLPAAPAATLRRSYLTGLTTNVLNPKIGVFYVATIPQFVPSGYPPLGVGLMLALVHVTLGLLWLGSLILASGWARRRLADPRALRAVDRVTGGVLIAFGVGLVWQHT